jgi:uncharacterized cupredoxin-like copper-binding protein
MRGNLIGAAVAVTAAAAVLTACGGGSGGTRAAGTTSSADSSAPAESSSSLSSSSSSADSGAAQTIQVSATEYKLTLPTTHFAPGAYTFVMKDDGHATHAIEIEGPGVSKKESETAGPGGSASLTVTLQKGSYTMYCPVGNHRAQGMETTLTVG